MKLGSMLTTTGTRTDIQQLDRTVSTNHCHPVIGQLNSSRMHQSGMGIGMSAKMMMSDCGCSTTRIVVKKQTGME